MVESDLHFSHVSFDEAGSYKLIELTADLNALVEGALQVDAGLKLTIKGHSSEDAVLCTQNKTFSMRSVSLSNTVLVVTPVPDERAADFSDDAIIVRDQLNEIVELVPVVPRLHKLTALIRERQYDETQEAETQLGDPHDGDVTRFTYQDALQQIQSSEEELKNGLKERRILSIHDELRPVAPAYLTRLLELILTLLVSLSLKHDSASIEQLLDALDNDHEIPRGVSEQVMGWFGEINPNTGKWKVDVNAVVKELGLGVLRDYRHEPIEKNMLLDKWRSRVGDTFESVVSLDLLEGNYVLSDVAGNDALKYFPAFALPVDPAARFSELFQTRSRWKAEEISPFLVDIAVNSKERDKLLLKYCRAITEGGIVRYSARAQYQG